MSQRSRIHAHYEPRVRPGRASFDILDWGSADSQQARFAVLARLLREETANHSKIENRKSEISVPLRLLDAGCGLADLRLHLLENGFAVDAAENLFARQTRQRALKKSNAYERSVVCGPWSVACGQPHSPQPSAFSLIRVPPRPCASAGEKICCGSSAQAQSAQSKIENRKSEMPIPLAYTGVDITPGILAEARRRQPDAHLRLADLFTEEPFPPLSFDAVYASGLFNLDLGNNAGFIRSGVPRLFALASRLLAVNFLHERTPHKYAHCHYARPDELLREFRPLASRAEIVADYLPNDFTLVLWR